MKKLNFVLGAILIGILVSACTTKSVEKIDTKTSSVSQNSANTTPKAENSQKIELNFWNPFTGDDGKSMTALVNKFNEENDLNITVSVQTLAYEDYYSKLPVTITSGVDVPDVAILHIDKLPYYSAKGLIMEMDEDIKNMGLNQSDFIEATWKASTQKDGKRYSLPLDTHPYVMFYNKKILKELGYSEGDLENLNGTKFLEMCNKAREKGIYGIGFYYPGMSSVFYSLLKQNGGEFIDSSNPTKAQFNGEAGIKAAQWVKELIDKGYATDVAGDHVSIFKKGESLFCADGIWSSAGMAEIEGLEWGEMFLPKVGSKEAIWASSHQLCIMKQKNEDKVKHEAALKFIKYLSDNSIEWAKAGQVAARLDVLKNPEFKSLPWGFTADKLNWFTYLPSEVTTGSFLDALNPTLVEYYSGTITDAKEALNKAAKSGEEQAALIVEK
jgi:extracellular solute-binding protein family 1